MNRSRIVDGALVVAGLAVLLVATLGLKSALRTEALVGDVGKHAWREAFVADAEYVGRSPVAVFNTGWNLKVRGGSMTFRTDAPAPGVGTGWTDATTHQQCTNTTTVCTTDLGAQAKTITLVNVSTGAPGIDPPPVTIPVGAVGWELQLYGRTNGGIKDVNNGITVCSNITPPCNPASGSTRMVALFTGVAGAANQSAFYPSGNAVSLIDDDGKLTQSVRYNNNGVACTTPSTNEDTCERISDIVVTVGSIANTFHCINGECVILISTK